MRVLLTLGLSAGGVGRHVHGLADGLVAAGHEVVVAAPSSAETTFGFAGTGARVAAVEVSDRPSPRLDAVAVGRLRGLSRGADVVHAHGLRAGALACLAATGTRVPVVVTLHNAAPAGGLTRAVYAALERVVARRATLVLGVSTDLVTRMQDLGARATGSAVVAAPPPPAVTQDPDAVRRSIRVPDHLSLVVSVGRLAAQKDFDTLLEAVALVRRGGTYGFVCVIAGDGPLGPHLQKRIALEGIPAQLLGRREDVPDLLAAADVVVSSAVWEGQPVWLQEALLVGAPIVATDAGGTRDTLRGAGRLVPPGAPRALAEGIRAVLTDPVERDALVELSRAAARRLPTQADAVAAALAAYRSAVGDEDAARPMPDLGPQ